MPGGNATTWTFLFTDLEGSTRLWEEEADSMRVAVARHDDIMRKSIDAHGGTVFSTGGDAFAAAFSDAPSAVRAALHAQIAMCDEMWPVSRPIRARMGLHTDTAEMRDNNFFGPPLNRCARLMSSAHGGQVVCSDATAALAREALATEVEFFDLGEHRLRDLSLPMRVFQVVHSSLPREFPRLRSLDAFATNLPAQLTAFVGREREVRDISSALGESRLVTLTGVGGVGKTRLAVQVAAEMLPVFGDGAFIIELGGVADPGAVDEAIAATLGVQQQAGQPLRESILGFLRGKRLLLVVDNCEHLLEPVADFVESSLAFAPEIAVLATSREALGVSGERVLGVRSLGLPARGDNLAELASAEAVRLFADRASAVRTGFEIGADNADAVVQLCRRLDGIPLAIELAAARVRSMSPAEIAERLDRRFRLLTGGTRRTADRHQTLRRAIDWSWDLLDELERTLMRRLAVCVGGFDLDAAEAIGAGEDIDALGVDDLLGRLVDKSLISVEDFGDATRYRMLETIREYSLEALEDSGDVVAVRERHAAHFALFADRAGAGMRSQDERWWTERVERELDNLRLAVAWSVSEGPLTPALRIIVALGQDGLTFGTSVGTWAESALDASGAVDDPRYGMVLAEAAALAYRAGDSDRCAQLIEAALAFPTADSAEAKRCRCRIFARKSLFETTRGRPVDDLAGDWLALARDIGDPLEEAEALTIVAVSRMYRSTDDVLAPAEEAVQIARRAGSPSVLAYCLLPLALALGATDPERAIRALEEAGPLADSVGNEFAAVICMSSQGSLLTQAGDHAGGMRLYVDAAVRSDRIGDRANVALCILFIASGLAYYGRPEDAARLSGWAEATSAGIEVHPLSPDDFKAAHRALPEALDGRYEGLLAAGAAMDDRDLLALARAAVDAIFD